MRDRLRQHIGRFKSRDETRRDATRLDETRRVKVKVRVRVKVEWSGEKGGVVGRGRGCEARYAIRLRHYPLKVAIPAPGWPTLPASPSSRHHTSAYSAFLNAENASLSIPKITFSPPTPYPQPSPPLPSPPPPAPAIAAFL